MIFVPGFKLPFLEKSQALESDALIFDLEDSVPAAFKGKARLNIGSILKGTAFKQKVFIRVNSISSGLLEEDLALAACENIDGFMPSMINDEADLQYIDDLISGFEKKNGFQVGKFKLCPLIETSSAVLRSYNIAKCSTRLVGLAFGGQDYLTDIDGLNTSSGINILTARSMIVMAAKAMNLEAIDTPFLNVRDLHSFKRDLEISRELGFSGRLILHPSQLQPANDIFTPSPEQIEEAKSILQAIDESRLRGDGVTLMDGNLVGPPMELRARKIIEKWQKIGESNSDAN
jgi:citrate lyase subunit beta/citryl-CoA lyase